MGLQRFVNRSEVSCLTNFRQPLERDWSCLFYGHGPSFKEEIEKYQTLEQKVNVVKKFLHLPS